MNGKIRIVRRPDGEAPEHIRDQWIGIEIPCIYKYDQNTGEVLIVGAVTGGITNKFKPQYCVLQDVAIQLLGEKSPEAKKWWNDIGYPESKSAQFFFSANSAEEIGQVLTRAEYKRLALN